MNDDETALHKAYFTPDKRMRDQIDNAVRQASNKGRAMGSHQSHRAQTTTWLTPPHVIESLGCFDLDPCAAPGWPTAKRHIILPEDGLTAKWEGRVWLNPPYGSEAWTWLNKLAEHGRGTALIFARTETAGFVEQVWEKAHGVKFLHGRLHFHRPDGTRAPANAGAPSVLVAYGLNDAKALAESDIPGTFLTIPRWEDVPTRYVLPASHTNGSLPF